MGPRHCASLCRWVSLPSCRGQGSGEDVDGRSHEGQSAFLKETAPTSWTCAVRLWIFKKKQKSRFFTWTLLVFKSWPSVSLKTSIWNSLAVQWLGLCAFTAEGAGSIPDRGTKIPQGAGSKIKSKNKNLYLGQRNKYNQKYNHQPVATLLLLFILLHDGGEGPAR